MSRSVERISEADLCRDFIAWAEHHGWTAYAETGGWDILLVKGELQLGVQAKRHFNATLLRQTIPHRYSDEPGPRYRAVLLPAMTNDIRDICSFCGLVAFYPYNGWLPRDAGDNRPFERSKGFAPALDIERWQVWPAKAPITLPAYKPDVIAGASAPIRLTEWKVGALKITALLTVRGSVTREDFRRLHIDHRRWTVSGWLLLENGVYRRGPKLNFDKQHPVVFAQILAETKATWASEPRPKVQRSLLPQRRKRKARVTA